MSISTLSKYIFLTLGLFIFLLSVDSSADDPPELRAFYAATFDINTQAKCDNIIANALASNINAVYVEVRARADSYYYPNREDSTYPNNEPRGQLYAISPGGLDVLQYFIDNLHEASPRVEVHAWLTTYNSWNRSTDPVSAQHIYNAHPEWITENEAGVTFTYADDAPLDPGRPDVQDHIYNVFMDVVRNYDIDGIHFDYIRLIDSDSGYDPVAKAEFLAETGWNYDTQNGAGQLSEVYEAWRRDQISQLVQRIQTQTQLEKPWVDVSAFIVNFTDSIENLGQGYNWWVAHKAIDVLHPSAYSTTISGAVADWNFSIGKLADNGDEWTRPAICAIGDYLLEDTNENAQAVTTIRGNSRQPDGFNFFDHGSLFIDGPTRTPPEPADQHAQNLFNPGGPMDDWAPMPVWAHKTALGAESTPPNAPASLSVAVSGGVPKITFNRPAAAGDGDLPVHYRLYRDTSTPVDLYFKNMVMEWWDPGSLRSNFSFDDASAATGSIYYTAVAYDDWNNEAASTAGPVVVSGGAEYIIETRSGGQNTGDYSESGIFINSSSHSTASGCTEGIGSRFALPGDANARNDKARFTPSGLSTSVYDVYVTCFNFSSANAQGITVRINDALGVNTSILDLTSANCGNSWAKVGSMNFTENQGHYVEFDNTTQTNIGDSTNSRMNAAAVRLVRAGSTPKEPKPPASVLVSSISEIIADSHPQSLDYDDLGSASTWQTSNLAGYYNGNSRYFSSSNFPMNSYAVWVIDLPQAGNWAIDGWVRHNTSFAQQAQYRFVDGGGVVHNVQVSQRSNHNDTATGDWLINVDGVDDAMAYFFKRGRTYVTVYGNNSGSETIIADALRFRLIESNTSVNWVIY